MRYETEQPLAHVLVVDDRPENLAVLRASLEPLGEHLVLAASGEEALAAMLRHDFAVVLLDVRMPGMDGYETASIIKSRERTRHVPIIFLTAIGADDQSTRRGYDVGAVDYLFKPFDPVVLASKVRVFVDLFHLKREAEALAHRALHDPLTGLPNRTLFRDRLEVALQRTARTPSTVSVFFIDLDGFKQVNDTYGHDAGDTLLARVSDRMRDALRPTDTVARLGGDEFAVLSEAVPDETAAAHIAERLIAAIETPVRIGEATARVSASIGIALTDEPSYSDELVSVADAAMYRAKGAGGSGWRVAGAPAASTPA